MKKNTLALAVATIASCSLVNMPVRAQTRSMSLDDMSFVLAAVVAIGECPQQFKPRGDAPLAAIVRERGYDLKDFTDGRYQKILDTKMLQVARFIKSNGKVKSCTAMRDLIEQNLPELYSSNSSDEKSKMAYEAIGQHFTCYSNMLETGTGNSKDCDNRFRQQLNRNGLCEYVSDRLRQRFCKDSSDADGKFK
jgi:hypothetical protein